MTQKRKRTAVAAAAEDIAVATAPAGAVVEAPPIHRRASTRTKKPAVYTETQEDENTKEDQEANESPLTDLEDEIDDNDVLTKKSDDEIDFPATLRKLKRASHRKKKSRRRIVSNTAKSNFFMPSHWHLENAIRSAAGYQGSSIKLCHNMPLVTPQSSGKERIEHLMRNGYTVQRAPT